ncbi:hypothetical protein I9018_15165 [Pseudomonas sp. MPFS]|uniref:hypothetical protein n=1 Tax=Pseudomonas sp. MPFS TaxID=2795724 RepID=UPI001F136756|nr:hypothetical protein [Pseudomonas sp. MPFS]UMZ14955.1 hypothetical protein I9018_15165 [Pseudomonas sp. MPFS]
MKVRAAVSRSWAMSPTTQGLAEQDPGPGLTDDQRVCREDQPQAKRGPRVDLGPADYERLKSS